MVMAFARTTASVLSDSLQIHKIEVAPRYSSLRGTA